MDEIGITYEDIIAEYKTAVGELFNQNVILKAQLKKVIDELAKRNEVKTESQES